MNTIDKDWAMVIDRNKGKDPCSSGPLKYLAKWILNKVVKDIRDYCMFCLDHDFDYQHGPKYNINKWKADWYLFKGICASGKWYIATLVYSGLTVGGWKAWNDWRTFDKKLKELEEFIISIE